MKKKNEKINILFKYNLILIIIIRYLYMLTINYLIKYLNIEQKKIIDIIDPMEMLPDSSKESPVFSKESPVFSKESPVFSKDSPVFSKDSPVFSKEPSVFSKERPESFESSVDTSNEIGKKFNDIFGNKNGTSLNPYYLDSKDKNRTHIFTIFNSIFSVMDSSFYLLKENSKKDEIKEIIKVFQNSLFEGELYKKYYFRNRRFRRTKFVELLNIALNFKTDPDYFYMIKQFISDYIGINIYILNDVESEYYISKKFQNNIESVGWIFCYYFEDIYYPVFFNDSTLTSNIIDTAYIRENIINKHGINHQTINNSNDIIDTKIYENMKLDTLQELAGQYKIDARKKSAKTDKLINKTKTELIEELLEFI